MARRVLHLIFGMSIYAFARPTDINFHKRSWVTDGKIVNREH